MAQTWVRLTLAILLAGTAGCRKDPVAGGDPAQPTTAPGAASLPASRPATSQASRPTTAAASRPTPAQRRERARRIADLSRRVDSLHEAGKYAQALPLQEELVQIAPDDGRNWYTLACLQSLSGLLDGAVASLEKSIQHGYAELRHMERDEDLKAIRLMPGYLRILDQREAIQRQRAAAVLEALRKRLGEGYVYQTDHEHRMVFAANVDANTLGEIRANLVSYAQAMSKDLFTRSFEQYVAVVVPKEGFLNQPFVGGYYSHAQRMLVARSIGMVLTHEFTHALHGADQEVLEQEHPIWIIEGLATLFESSEIRGGVAVPQHNSRLNVLQRLAARKQTVPLAEFLRWDQRQFVNRAMVAYPQGCYLLMYLYDKGLLKKWYDAYTASYASDSTGADALEEVLGKKLPQIEADWLSWVQGLTPPPVRVEPGHAYIGVAVSPGIDGLKIGVVAPGSGAEAADLKVGDLILRIDGKRMTDPEDLVLLVNEREVGEVVRVAYRRDGQEKEVSVLLKAMPAPPTRPSRRTPTASSSAPATSPSSGPATGPATAPSTRPARRPPPPLPGRGPRGFPTSRPISQASAEPIIAG